jgi:hypothetical protein
MSPPEAIIAPSALAADFGQLTAELRRMLGQGADWLHMGKRRFVLLLAAPFFSLFGKENRRGNAWNMCEFDRELSQLEFAPKDHDDSAVSCRATRVVSPDSANPLGAHFADGCLVFLLLADVMDGCVCSFVRDGPSKVILTSKSPRIGISSPTLH